jgi:hypothetical protein
MGSGIRDINNVQGLILFNVGDGAEMPIGELTLRGCYLGSKVSYNRKKTVDARSTIDARPVCGAPKRKPNCATGRSRCTSGMSRYWSGLPSLRKTFGRP